MTALDKFIMRLNARPVIWTLSLGVIVYFCAFWLAVLGMFERFPLIFEVGFLSAGSLVMGYHWLMSRYIKNSNLAQFVQLAFGLTLVSLSMLLIGASIHNKAYEWVNTWIHL